MFVSRLGSGGFVAELLIADEGMAELNASNPLDLSKLRRVIAFGVIREAMETPCGHVRSAATYRHGKSKDEFQTELDIAIIGNGIRDGPERTKLIGIKTGDCSVRSTQLRAVKGVEELGPELQLHRFANREVLDRGELRNGLMVWDLNGISREPWQNRTQSYSDPRWDATLPARR